jgi:uncharacterized protein YcfJ
MKIIDPYSSLSSDILVKEAEQMKQGVALKEHFRETYESLKPINILKNTFKTAASSGDLKSKVANATIGMAAGFLAKKLLGGSSGNPITKLVGTLVGSFIGSKAEQNADGIRSLGSFLINKLANHSLK